MSKRKYQKAAKIGWKTELPLLSADEMRVLGRQIQRGRQAQESLQSGELTDDERSYLEVDLRNAEAARTRLIEHNMPMAINYGARYAALVFAEPEEMIAEAMLGLTRAASTYDPDRYGTVFSTHASWVIRRTCQAALKDITGMSRTRSTLVLQAFGGWFEGDDGNLSDPSEAVTFDARPNEDAEDWGHRVAMALEPVSDRERQILRLRHEEGLKLVEIGRRFGVSKERVRQILIGAEKSIQRSVPREAVLA